MSHLRVPVETASGFHSWQILLAVAAILAILLLFISLYRRSRRQAVPVFDPVADARAEIEAAEQVASSDSDYAGLCAGAVRRLLQHRYNMPAGSGHTTKELLYKLPLDGESKQPIRDFLQRCDNVKFARQTLTREERIEISDTARRIVDKLNGEERPA